MVKRIKQYKLKENLTDQNFVDIGFKLCEAWGSIKKHWSKCIPLTGEVTIDFDIDYETHEDTTTLIDDDFGQPYTAFYRSEHEFPFLTKVITAYNKEMDKMVDLGIYKHI